MVYSARNTHQTRQTRRVFTQTCQLQSAVCANGAGDTGSGVGRGTSLRLAMRVLRTCPTACAPQTRQTCPDWSGLVQLLRSLDAEPRKSHFLPPTSVVNITTVQYGIWNTQVEYKTCPRACRAAQATKQGLPSVVWSRPDTSQLHARSMNADTATGDCNPLPTRDRRPVHSLQQRSRAWQKALDRRQRQRLNKYAYNSGTYPWPVHNEQQPLHTCSSGDGERKDWNALWSRHVDTNEDNLQDNKEKKTNIKNENHNGATWSMLHDLGHALVAEARSRESDATRSEDGTTERTPKGAPCESDARECVRILKDDVLRALDRLDDLERLLAA